MNIEKCNLCPHNCGVNRSKNIGRCRANDKVKVALASLHYYEEPCISGKEGSGTVFFSNCNLSCVYCQNYEISKKDFGKEIRIEKLADIFLSQQEKGANNINLVSPTIYVYQIKEAIIQAKKMGLTIPIIYNSSGYEKVETLKELEGLIDIYLPDFKYGIDDLAKEYSKVNNYFEICKDAILEMYRQVGSPVLDENGIIKKGLIIRHLILPNQIQNTKIVLKTIKDILPSDVYVSIMAQYFPCGEAKNIKELNRKITKEEYKEIEDYVYELGFQNGYMQDLGEHEEEYVPNFDLSGII